MDRQPVRAVVGDPAATPAEPWVQQIPAVAQLLDEGLQLPAGVTLLVGENGTGKSTIVQALAMAFGLSPEGGTPFGRHSTRPSKFGLHEQLILERGAGAAHWGFFLRAEAMHGYYTFVERSGGSPRDPQFHAMSHGESFLEILRTRSTHPGSIASTSPERYLRHLAPD